MLRQSICLCSWRGNSIRPRPSPGLTRYACPAKFKTTRKCFRNVRLLLQVDTAFRRPSIASQVILDSPSSLFKASRKFVGTAEFALKSSHDSHNCPVIRSSKHYVPSTAFPWSSKTHFQQQEKTYLFAVVDELSRYPFAFPCTDLTKATVINCWSQIFTVLGLPAYTHSDREPLSCSKTLKNICAADRLRQVNQLPTIQLVTRKWNYSRASPENGDVSIKSARASPQSMGKPPNRLSAPSGRCCAQRPIARRTSVCFPSHVVQDVNLLCPPGSHPVKCCCDVLWDLTSTRHWWGKCNWRTLILRVHTFDTPVDVKDSRVETFGTMPTCRGSRSCRRACTIR